MKTISFVLPKFISVDAYTDIDRFIESVKYHMYYEGIVNCIMQPGRGTRYEFVIFPYENGHALARPFEDYIKWFPHLMILKPDNFYPINPVTARVFADVINKITGAECRSYYDFVNGDTNDTQ